MKDALGKYISQFELGQDLPVDEAETFLDRLICCSEEEQISRALTAWHKKGIGEDEIYGLARVLRGRCRPVHSTHDVLADIVGTGGGRTKTFNVSTAAAFVVAGAGIPVAKHGNRAATSLSGSTDVLQALGIFASGDPDFAQTSLEQLGICFMYAPDHHALSPVLGRVRRRLGFPTVFNCVGPLCNPAGARHNLIGVWSREMVGKMARALLRLGSGRSWIVHGSEGLDEVSLSTKTHVAEVTDNEIREFELAPADFGMDAVSTDGIGIQDPEQSAEVIRGVLEPGGPNSRPKNLVTINAASSIYVAGHAADLVEAKALAAESIESGNAKLRLENLINLQSVK